MGCLALPLAGIIHAGEPASRADHGQGCKGSSGQSSDCKVYPVGHMAARANGHFGHGSKAFAVQPLRCAAGSCAVVLGVGGERGRPMVLRIGLDCDHGVKLRLIRLFPGRDSLELVCRASSGAGWKERRVFVDAGADALTPLFALDTGSYIEPSPAEKKAGTLPSCPVGSIRVEKVADKPILRVADPSSGELQDGKGTLVARQFAFDPAHREFRPTGEPDHAIDVDAHAGCHR